MPSNAHDRPGIAIFAHTVLVMDADEWDALHHPNDCGDDCVFCQSDDEDRADREYFDTSDDDAWEEFCDVGGEG